MKQSLGPELYGPSLNQNIVKYNSYCISTINTINHDRDENGLYFK